MASESGKTESATKPGGSTEEKTPAQIEAEIEATREELGDTAAALALVLGLAAAGSSIGRTINLKQPHASVIETVRAQVLAPQGDAPRSRAALGAIGFAVAKFGRLLHAHFDFAGRLIAALTELAAHPERTRWKELAAQFQHVCIEAIPVVTLVSALIGTVLAYLFGLQAGKYGASIFVVDAVAIGRAMMAGRRARCNWLAILASVARSIGVR